MKTRNDPTQNALLSSFLHWLFLPIQNQPYPIVIVFNSITGIARKVDTPETAGNDIIS